MGRNETGITAQQLEEYKEVYAQSSGRNGISTYETDSSGRTPTGGVYVLWSRTNGYTGQGWELTIPDSPSYGLTQEDIDEDLLDDNLNTTFSTWATRVPDINARLTWLLTLPDGCKENA